MVVINRILNPHLLGVFLIFISVIVYSQDSLKTKNIEEVNFVLNKGMFKEELKKNTSNSYIVALANHKTYSIVTKCEFDKDFDLKKYHFLVTSRNKRNKLPLFFVIYDENKQIFFKQAIDTYQKGINELKIISKKLPAGTFYFGLNYDLDVKEKENYIIKREFTYTNLKGEKGEKIEYEIGPRIGNILRLSNTLNYFVINGVFKIHEKMDIYHNLEFVYAK